MDLTSTIEADSTQVNAVDLTGSSRIVTITGISGGPDKKQPVNIELAEFPGRAYRPCKTMRRILVHAWGPDTRTYIGRRMEIYNEESVKWGGKAVGGVRIRALSDIPARFDKTLQESQKTYVTYSIDPLPDAPPPTTKAPSANAIIDAFKALGVSLDQLETRVGSPQDAWTAEDVAALSAVGKSIKSGATTLADEFPDPDTEDAGQLGLADGES
jgi:hypothetical protein